jgi:hypothetical protein
MITGVPLARLTYGHATTTQRYFRSSLKFGLFNAMMSIPYTYFMIPYAQEPCRGTLQWCSWEQGFKNYIDKKYDLYRNAEFDFYNTLTSQQR